MKKIIYSVVLLLSLIEIKAQNEKDTLNIKEVVITGQYSPQSIKKSLYKVELISSEDLKKMATNNVAETLSQMQNLLIVPERNSGDSKANILGLRADYTKILIDNIPVIGDTGLGNNIDLTKISIDNIERIEIVKGSMGVEFGNNAMAGVINIITKKSSKKQWNFRGLIQEETVGNEYDWVDYGKGRHIQNIGISHSFAGGKLYADIALNRNDFQGYRGELKGKNYFERDSKRGYNWQPKEQWNPSFLLRYNTSKTQILYKANYLSEEINYYNPLVEQKYLGGGERTFVANDRDYFTQRMLHHLNISIPLFHHIKYVGDFSYQKQSRKYQNIIFDIPARKRIFEDHKNIYYDAEVFYTRNTFSNLANSDKINIQFGYEADYTKGFAGAITGKFNENLIKKDILNNSVFASAEIMLNDTWFLRPGFRYNFSSSFKSKPNYSIVLKNNINTYSEFRAIIGSANRNPTFEELYTYFVDSNHNIQGNENLKPENSYSGTLYYSIFGDDGNNWKWSADFSTMYMQVKDMIEMVQTSNIPLKFRYMNIGRYELWENMFSGKISTQNFGLNLGYTIIGKMSDVDSVDKNQYRFNQEVVISTWYDIKKTGTMISAQLKYSGKNYSFFEDKSLGINQISFKERKDFTLFDMSVSQKLWKNYFSLVVGVRNIFNVTDVSVGSGNSGMHNTSNNQLLFYGRSYFTRLNFTF